MLRDEVDLNSSDSGPHLKYRSRKNELDFDLLF